MSHAPDDRLAEYLRRDERFDDAALWLRHRVDAPNLVISEDSPNFSQHMLIAWPAQLSQSHPDQRERWNVVERLVIEMRLRAIASPPGTIDDLTGEIRKLSSAISPPLDRALLDCWDATVAMLYEQDSVSNSFALGRLLSAYAACPGWGIALDIALCADWIRFFGERDGDLGISDEVYRAAFKQVVNHDDAPSSVYVEAMLAELRDAQAFAEGGETALNAAVALAHRSVAIPEHPWIEFYLGDQLLCSTQLSELQHETTSHLWPLRVLYASAPPELGSFRSVIVPMYALPGEDAAPEVAEQRSFGNAFGGRSLTGSTGPIPLLPREVGLDCAYTAFGRAYLANGDQPGGTDDVLAVNAAAALVCLGALLARQELLNLASLTLLDRLQAGGIERGSIPELDHVIELATVRNLSRWKPTEPPVRQAATLASSTRQSSSTSRHLDRSDKLRSELGEEEPRVWERGPQTRRAVQAELAQHPWWPSCDVSVQYHAEEAMTARELGVGPDTWASQWGKAVEAMIWQTIGAPLQQHARSAGAKQVSLHSERPSKVDALRKELTPGTIARLIREWRDGSLIDKRVGSFFDSHVDDPAAARLQPLISQAAELRNSTAHPAPFGEVEARTLERVALELFPLLAQLTRP